MQAVILAAGIGERLGSLTQKIPKPMIKVNELPILEHNILMCKKNGVDDILINLHHLPEVIKDYFGNGSKWGVKIQYRYEPKLLGTAGTVYNFRDLLKDSFYVIYGDNYFNSYTSLDNIKNFHDKVNSDFTIALCHVDDISNSGLVNQDSSGKINGFVEKPESNEINEGWVNAGIYYLTLELLNGVENNFNDFGVHLIPYLIKSRYNVYGIKLNNKVIAIDTPDLFNKEINYGK
jgi:NDP-sugar pyrophosphorylase family protein